MPTITILADGTIPTAADFNGNFDRLNKAIGANTGITTYTTGDTLYASATDTLARRGIGSAGEILTVVGGVPAWATPGTASGTWSQRGLTGTVTATTIAVSAYAVTLRNSSFGMKVHENTGTHTLDSATAGLNGRDQTAVFTAGQTLHAYWISNGTTLRTVLADSDPATGPDLVTLGAFAGYTYWTYIGPFIWNGSSNFVPALIRGAHIFYQGRQNVHNAVVTAGVETSVSYAAIVPVNALEVLTVHSPEAVSPVEPIKIRIVSGVDWILARGAAVNAVYFMAVTLPTTAAQTFFILVTTQNRPWQADVLGYTVPNGAE